MPRPGPFPRSTRFAWENEDKCAGILSCCSNLVTLSLPESITARNLQDMCIEAPFGAERCSAIPT